MYGICIGVSKQVIIDKEASWGVKPATNSVTAKYLPRVSLDLNLSREQFRSERINSHSQVAEARSVLIVLKPPSQMKWLLAHIQTSGQPCSVVLG